MFFTFIELVLICTISSTHATTKFHVKNNRILDEYNRELFFHGLNVVYKSFPYLPITDHFDANLSFSEQDMQLFKSLGLNIVRLGVMWPGVNPDNDVTNHTYISLTKDIIKTAYENYGIYTLVDHHQDVFSETLCGEGVPAYAVRPSHWNFPEPVALKPYSTGDDHIPSRSDCLSHTWSTYYVAQAVGSAFQSLYSNYYGLAIESFAKQYWLVLAQQLKDLDGIIGFELMNEPFAGDIYKDPLLMFPGEADRKNLQPFYDMVVPYIYGADPDRLVFFESVTWTDDFNVSVDRAGFTHVPGGEQYSNRSVYSFHYYDPPNFGSQEKYFWARTDDAIKWKATSMLTEFFIHDSTTTSETMDYCDQFLVSWIGWEYKKYAGALPDGTCTGCGYGLFTKEGVLNTDVAKIVSRTYPQKVAGKTSLIKFDSKTGDFLLQFAIDVSISKPTIVYTNLKYWYTDGYNVALNVPTSVVRFSVEDGGSHVYFYNTNDSQYDGTMVQVSITAK